MVYPAPDSHQGTANGILTHATFRQKYAPSKAEGQDTYRNRGRATWTGAIAWHTAG
ncbi:hypothetical protein GCM10020220_005920 [Nonomuraea rubra]